MNLPVNAGTFKRGFLDGRGEVELTLPPGVAGALRDDAPIPGAVPFLACGAIAASTPALTFGGDGPFRCTATFSASSDAGVEVIRPGRPSDALQAYAPDYTVPDGQMALRLFVRGTGEVSADAPVPLMSGLRFGIGAGGHIGFSRVVAMPAETPARAALLDLVSDMRLPQRRGRPADLPQPGEVVMVEYGGFLGVRAALAWGYALSATDALEPGRLDVALDYALRLKAELSLGYRLAGRFLMAVRQGERPGWVRLSVHKHRESAFSFAAGFAADGEAGADFTWEAVEETLLAFLGADARRALEVFDQVRGLTDLEALEARVGKLLVEPLQRLSHRWVGRALDETSLGDVGRALGEAVDAYRSLDQRVVDLYEDYAKRTELDRLRRVLRQVAELDGEAAMAAVRDAEVRAVVQRLGGEALFAIVARAEAFTEIQARAQSGLALLDGSRLADVIDQLQQDLRLDDLTGRLAQVSSPDALRALTDRALQGVVERIVGRAFEDIAASDARQAFEDVRRTLDRIEAFRTELTRRIEKVLTESVSMEINYAYARASSEAALIDIELDVGTPRGAALFDLAAAGRMAEVLAGTDLDVVRVHEAVLTHQIRRSGHLQLNFVGWRLGRLVELVSDTEFTLEEHAGGLVQLFTTTESLRQRREKGRSAKEVAQSVFLITLAGEVDRAGAPEAARRRLQYLAATVSRMSAACEQLFIDERTTLPEMYEYLALARWLELIPPVPGDPDPLPVVPAPGSVPSIDRFIASLADEFPQGLGRVAAQYVVRYDDDAVRDAFTAASGAELEARVSQSCRRLIGGHLLIPGVHPIAAAQGAAYCDGALRQAFEVDGATAVGGRSWTVTLPAWIGSPLANRAVRLEANREAQTVAAALILERDLCRAVRRLDALVEHARHQKRPVPVRDLSRAAHDVLRAGAGLDGFFGVNVLFGVMDDLIQQGSRGKARRQSSLVLRITPPGGAELTKYLMAGRT